MSEQAMRMRLYRARRKAEGGLRKGDPRHGTTNGYDNYGCRCKPCTAAATERVQKWRQAGCH